MTQIATLYLAAVHDTRPDYEIVSTWHRWSGRAGDYQRLFEPVDIAKWYGKGIHVDGAGHYIDQLDRPGDANKRPGASIASTAT